MLSILRCCSNKIQPTLFQKIQCRKYMKISEKMELLMKQVDLVPRHYYMIYRENAYRTAALMYHTVNFITCATVATLGYLWYYDIPLDKEKKHFEVGNSKFEKIILGLALSSSIIIATITRSRYAIRVYYSEKDKMYRVILLGKVPMTSEYHSFPAKTMTYVSKDSVLPWRNSLFNCNGRKIMLFDNNFRTPDDFLQMLKPGQEKL